MSLTLIPLNDPPSPATAVRQQTDARYLRAVLTFLLKASEEQVKQIPVIGPALLGFAEAVKELSKDKDGDQTDARVEAQLNQLEQQLGQLLTQGERANQFNEGFAALASLLLEQQYQHTALLAQLTGHLQMLGLPTEQKQLTGIALTAALTAYRSRIIREYQYADQRGIQGVTRHDRVANLPLTDIYVKPRLQFERAAARSLFESRERERELLKQMLDYQDLPTGQQARLEEEFALLTGERWRGKKEQDVTLSIGEALQRARHTVVLGGPGVGKSQLTRYLALVCARGEASMREQLGWAEELTPIVVSLAAFADARSRIQVGQSLTLRQHLDAELERRGGAALRAAIEQEMQAGRVLVLLDGVDEVPDFTQRSAIVVEVESFLRDHGAIRCLVTSRPYGYIRLAGDVAHFELLNFSEEQVGEFIRRWQRAFEEWQHRDAPNYEAATREAEEMFDELKGNPKVLELATNPLMLVIIVLIRYEQTRLPQERVRLYDIAVKTLMETWNFWRSKVAGVNAETQLKTDDLIIVWSAIAEWTRRTKPTGVVHRGELKNKLVEILEAEDLGGRRPAETAEAYLDAAARRAGLLEERGPDIFAFWHPTFEEFLAAINLTTPAHRAKERLLPLRRAPRWREVILLAVGHLGLIQRDRETASAIVESLALDDPDPLEPVLHKHLLLAAKCVVDNAGLKRSTSELIIVELAAVIRDQPYLPFEFAFSETVQALPNLLLTINGVLNLAHLEKYPYSHIRVIATRLFSKVSDIDREASRLCEHLFLDDYYRVYSYAALGLVRAGDYRLEVWRKLFGIWIAGEVVNFLKDAPRSAIESLRSFLTHEDRNLRYNVASFLREVGQMDAKVKNALRYSRSSYQVLNIDPTKERESSKLVERRPLSLTQVSLADGLKIFVRSEWYTSDLQGTSEETLIEIVTRKAALHPGEALAAGRKLLHGHPLDADDGQALAELVRRHDEDTEEQRFAREWMFEWLWRKHQPKGDT